MVWCGIYVSVLPLVSHRNHLLHSLGGNKIGPEGAKAMAEALHANRSLTELDVRNNGFDDESEALLRDAVKDKNGFQLSV